MAKTGRLLTLLIILLVLVLFLSYFLLFGDKATELFIEQYNLSNLDIFGFIFPDHNPEVSGNPVIFVHGHSITQYRTVLYSLQAFEKFQRLMDKQDHYINLGIFLLTNTTRLLPDRFFFYNDTPPSFRITYYADELGQSLNIIIKKENQKTIDEYSLILKKNIDEILRLTGAKKVSIVAHSMGGLVARNYIEFHDGSRNVDKLVMIGTPNNGLRGFLIGDFCNLLHPGPECNQMYKKSEFITKLNSKKLDEYDIKILNIVGQCCSFPGSPEFSDEVIFVSDALLAKTDNIKNLVVYGKKNLGIDAFHNDMLSPVLYPEVYNKTTSFLME